MQRLATLVRNTPERIQKSAAKVRVTNFSSKSVRRTQVEGRDVWEIEYKTSGSGESHNCIVRFFGPTIKQDALVWVSCDCEDFRYRLEYALAQKKSSDRMHSNFNPPVKTNPKMETRLCKHLLKIKGIIPLALGYLKERA